MSNPEAEPIIPRSAVPLAVGEITALADGEFTLTELTSGARTGFTSAGDFMPELQDALMKDLAKYKDVTLFKLDTNQETGEPVRERISLDDALATLRAGTVSRPAHVELVVPTEKRNLTFDATLAPEGTRIGDILGLWVEPHVTIEAGVGKTALAAAQNLSQATVMVFQNNS